ncbi:MAG: protein-L-isoaspartate(D-aspartate) O-methyltransferase [Gammaproteobacteria bacterium]|nr:protein-L-isoaspartate(D-aspartate) O-methyltransferase [Gammaproteobacteria bacterium]
MTDNKILQAVLLVAIMTSATCTGNADDEARYATEHAQLVRVIEARVRDASYFLGKSELDPRVMAAMAQVRRHEFVPEYMRWAAYENRPLPIGEGQTISQPSLVAMMTDLLNLSADCRVLEIGTGSGYQAAILAEICDSVYSIEIVEPLGLRAAALLERLGYDNVEVRIGDGFAGWPEQAPFEAIIVTAAAEEPPPPLVEQLAVGGRMIIPLGPAGRTQDLYVIKKTADGSMIEETIFPVRFVPFTRDEDQAD